MNNNENVFDRYPVRTQLMTNEELIREADRLEGMDNLDSVDRARYRFVRSELAAR